MRGKLRDKRSVNKQSFHREDNGSRHAYKRVARTTDWIDPEEDEMYEDDDYSDEVETDIDSDEVETDDKQEDVERLYKEATRK
jgi:hypothetical protein